MREKTDTERSQESLGQMPTLKSFSFCCLVTRVASTFSRRDTSFSSKLSLACVLVEWIDQAFPGLCTGGVDRHRSSKKPESGVTDVGDGFLIQYQIWVVWLAAECVDG